MTYIIKRNICLCIRTISVWLWALAHVISLYILHDFISFVYFKQKVRLGEKHNYEISIAFNLP